MKRIESASSGERWRTLWDAVTPLGRAWPRLAADAAADLAVIGGGFLGMSAALAAARGGRRVVVLEAGRIGAGASGRNAGFVVPHLSRAAPRDMLSALGERQGRALLALLAGSGTRFFELARDFSLGHDVEQVGWLQPAHSAAMAVELRRRVADWQALGRSVVWLGAEEASARLPLLPNHGALADPSGGMVNPLAFLRALAAAAAAASVAIHEESAAASADAAGGRWRIRTEAGATLAARQVLLCTNGGTRGAARMLGRVLVPLTVYQIATEPLDPALAARIAPGREPVSDTRTDIFTYRLGPENRLISGGVALLPVRAEARMARRIATRLARELRLPAVPGVAHVWRGTASMTRDGLPRVVALGPNGFGAVGCNGRGVAFSTAFGEILGRMLAGELAQAELPVPVAGEAAVPLRAVARAVPSLVLLRGRWRERGGAAAGATA